MAKCEMCGAEKEIVGYAKYIDGKQYLCKDCMVEGIPEYTVVYHKEDVKKYIGDEEDGEGM